MLCGKSSKNAIAASWFSLTYLNDEYFNVSTSHVRILRQTFVILDVEKIYTRNLDEYICLVRRPFLVAGNVNFLADGDR